MRSFLILMSIALLGLPMGCKTASYAENGAGLGAVTGALAGASLGGRSGNAGTGAVLGAAAGALGGAAIGQNIDEDVARNDAIIEQRMGHRLAAAVGPEDVIAMSQAGLSDQVIITHIRSKGVARPMEVGDLITLRNAGVRDAVIQSMQTARPPTINAGYPVATRPAPPVVIHEHYPTYVPPVRFHYRHHHPRPRPRRAGVSWGMSIRN